MPYLFTDEQFVRLDDDARQLEEQTGSQERRMEILLSTAEADVQLSLSALSRPQIATQACVDRLSLALRAQLRRCEESVKTARQLCAAARENRLAMRRLVSDLSTGLAKGAAAAPQAIRRAVLVVDDYEDGRDLLATLLQRAGFIVRTASNGLEAIIAAYEMKPAVIVMDVAMPVLGGLEATRLIKALDTIRDARVIAYTATPLIEDVRVSALFDEVLQKPASPDAVLEVVRRYASVGPPLNA